MTPHVGVAAVLINAEALVEADVVPLLEGALLLVDVGFVEVFSWTLPGASNN
jgi:hypothetical protein